MIKLSRLGRLTVTFKPGFNFGLSMPAPAGRMIREWCGVFSVANRRTKDGPKKKCGWVIGLFFGLHNEVRERFEEQRRARILLRAI